MLKQAGGNPYPHTFTRSHQMCEYVNEFAAVVEPGSKLPETTCRVAGRIRSVRITSKKLVFYDIHSGGVKLQVMATAKMYHGAANFKEITKTLKRDDYIGVIGYPAKTRLGELSIVPQTIELLAPCLHLVPGTFHGLKNKDVCYRRRYLDMIVNGEATTTTLSIRPKVNKYIRRFFDARGFEEVETPILCTEAGGAAARPFATHHNAMHVDMQLRISPELPLKMLVVGGMERVYELGKVNC